MGLHPPATLAVLLESGSGAVYLGTWAGLAVLAEVRPEDFVLIHPLSATGPRPTQQEVASMLDDLEACGRALQALPELAAVLTGLSLKVQVEVRSGPMDFIVAERQGGQEAWHVDLV